MERTLYTDEDQAIVEIPGDLCRCLNAIRFKPKRVSWVAVRSNRSGNRLASDSCAFSRTRVFMPVGLRGKLGPDELRSVITPALIFQSKSGIRLRHNLASFFWIPYLLGMSALGSFVGFRILNLQRGTLAADVFLTMFLIIFFLFLFFIANRSALYAGRLWFVADRQAAKLVGKQSLLQTLEKIDAMKLADNEQRKTRKPKITSLRRRPSWRPSIVERINNLALDTN